MELIALTDMFAFAGVASFDVKNMHRNQTTDKQQQKNSNNKTKTPKTTTTEK